MILETISSEENQNSYDGFEGFRAAIVFMAVQFKSIFKSVNFDKFQLSDYQQNSTLINKYHF